MSINVERVSTIGIGLVAADVVTQVVFTDTLSCLYA